MPARHLLPLTTALCFLLMAQSVVPSPDNSSASSAPNVPLSPSANFSASSASLVRSKRQWGGGGQWGAAAPSSPPAQCPPHCFACTPMHCQAYQCLQPQQVPMVRCCCRPVMLMRTPPDLKTACDGEEAVAACMNGLCGQGYFCQRDRFCCRCPAGKSIGRCVNGLCPAGYLCNSNDFCCAVGNIGSAIGPCVNGECPGGYECGEGDLCYPRAGTGGTVSRTSSPTRNFPPIGRIKPRPRWTPMTTTKRRGKKQRKGKEGGGRRGWRWWERRGQWEDEEAETEDEWGEGGDEYRRR